MLPFGSGMRSSPLRYMRLVMLGALLLLGGVFHHSGSTYSVIRGIYLVLLLGGLIFYASRRSAGRPGRFSRGMPTGGMPFEAPSPTSGTSRAIAPGWYRDATDATLEHYWDGRAWTGGRRWDGNAWIDQAGG